MYTEHFGLKMLPFENVPDPAFFFNEGDYARVRRRIGESLTAHRSLTILTGPAGSGKTTLSQMITSDLSQVIKVIWMAEPPASIMDFFLFIAQELGLEPSEPVRNNLEKLIIIRYIGNALLKIKLEGSKCLLIIDEAHLMTDDVLNGIRILNNYEENSHALIQILLLGREELMEKINRPEMAPFKQCIDAIESLGKMQTRRIYEYIAHRVEVAGGKPSIFDDTGLEALRLACSSAGVPRIINSLCDRSLNAACERKKKAVDVDDVYEAAKELGLEEEVFNYKYSLVKAERGEQVLSAEVFSTVTEAGPPDNVPVLSRDLEEIHEEHGNGQSGVPSLPRQGPEIAPVMTGTGQKYLKEYCGAFLRNMVRRIVRKPSSKGETLISLKESKVETVDDFGSGIGDMAHTAGKAAASCEWVTVDSSGARPFIPPQDAYKKPEASEETSAKQVEWVAGYTKTSEKYNIPASEGNELRETEGSASSGWTTINTTLAKSTIPRAVHVKAKVTMKSGPFQ